MMEVDDVEPCQLKVSTYYVVASISYLQKKQQLLVCVAEWRQKERGRGRSAGETKVVC